MCCEATEGTLEYIAERLDIGTPNPVDYESQRWKELDDTLNNAIRIFKSRLLAYE